MKRSEAIEKLVEASLSLGEVIADSTADQLLNIMVNILGMYPPCRRDGKYDWESEDSVPKMSPTRSITDGNQDS